MADDLEETVKEAGAPEDAAVREGRPSRAERASARRQAAAADSEDGGHDPAGDVFTVERLLGPEAEAITGHPQHVVAGALHGFTGDEVRRDEIAELIESYHAREITPAE